MKKRIVIVLCILTVMLTICTFLRADTPLDTLPEFSNRWYLTAVYSNEFTEDDSKLASALRTKTQLGLLTTQTVFNEWDNRSEIVKKTKWSQYLGTARPALLLQAVSDSDGKGRVVFFGSGQSLINRSDLPGDIQKSINRYVEDCPSCPLRPRPRPEPTPSPSPEPAPQPNIVPEIIPTVLVDTETKPEDDGGGIPLVLALLIPAIGAGLGLRASLKQDTE